MDKLPVKTVTDALQCTRAGLARMLDIDRAAVYQWGEYVPKGIRTEQCKKLMADRQTKSYLQAPAGVVRMTIQIKTPVLAAGVF